MAAGVVRRERSGEMGVVVVEFMGDTGGVPESLKLSEMGCGRCLEWNVDGWKLSELGLGGGSCCCCSMMMGWLLWSEVIVVAERPPGDDWGAG